MTLIWKRNAPIARRHDDANSSVFMLPEKKKNVTLPMMISHLLLNSVLLSNYGLVIGEAVHS